MLLDIVSGNGLGILAQNGVTEVLIIDNIDSKTFDTMINLTYILSHHENVFSECFKMLLLYCSPSGHS